MGAAPVAGIIGGGVTVFFWKGTRYFVGAMGGIAFGLWIECFRDGGLIDAIGFRYIMFIGMYHAEAIDAVAHSRGRMCGYRLRFVYHQEDSLLRSHSRT
jgi:hypothetical protein